MTQHHIAGSEVGRSRPLAYLTQLRPGRRSLAARLRGVPLVVWLHLAMIPLGVLLAAIDDAMGGPIAIILVLALLWLWPFPSGRGRG